MCCASYLATRLTLTTNQEEAQHRKSEVLSLLLIPDQAIDGKGCLSTMICVNGVLNVERWGEVGEPTGIDCTSDGSDIVEMEEMKYN